MNQSLKTPVALIVFNRPDTTRLVFEAIRRQRPRVLMVISDGPRPDRRNDAARCAEVRKIVERVDWPCELMRCESEENLGCGVRMAGGIDWVFGNVEEAIILEDDCVPDPTFFGFCAELLERYRDQPKVMHISGSSALFGRSFTADSYYFSRYAHCWGWATWRRAWRHFDFEMKVWKANPQRCLAHFEDSHEREFWRQAWDRLASGELNAWAHRWCLACLNANGLAVTPSVNLVENVGFGPNASHTTSRLAAVRPAVGAMGFPLRHPRQIERNRAADAFTARRFFYNRSIPGKAAEIVRRRLLAAVSHVRSNGHAQPGVPAPTSVRSK